MSEYVSLQTFAEMASLSPVTVRRRIADGTIQARRIGRLIRIRPAELRQLGRDVRSA